MPPLQFRLKQDFLRMSGDTGLDTGQAKPGPECAYLTLA